MATTLGQANPFRYRGYYFDTESGLYYLQSRYYDPNTGRFINADDTSILQMTQGELLGGNLYAYCGNCPVMNVDPSGYSIVTRAVDAGNNSYLFSPIINQNALKDKYGNGYSRNNGCAWIAAYNIMLLTGNFLPTHVVKKALISMGGLILRGSFGTSPESIYRFIKQRLSDTYSVNILYGASVKNMEKYVAYSDYVIVTSFWYNSIRGNFFSLIRNSRAAAHTFAGKRINSTKFEFYNETYHNKVVCTISDLFKNRSNNSSYSWSFPICIISIKSRSRFYSPFAFI